MHIGSWWFLGMHALWWVFWIVLLVWAFRYGVSTLSRRGPGRETPLELLQRRYAAGELTTQQFEERRSRLESSTASSS